MKKVVLITLLFTFILSLNAIAGEKTYGDKITTEKDIEISELVDNPEIFLGKDVSVSGTVVGVCATRGCWLELADKNDKSIKVKVNDGEIIFPIEAKGQKARVQGKLYKLEFDKEGQLINKVEDVHVCSRHTEEDSDKAKSSEKVVESDEAAEKSEKSEEASEEIHDHHHADDAKDEKVASVEGCKKTAAAHAECKRTAVADSDKEKADLSAVVYQIKGTGAVIFFD